MSAFLCDNLHLSVLAGYAAHNLKYGQYADLSPEEIGAVLYAENVRSLNYRYPDEVLPLTGFAFDRKTALALPLFSPVEIIKACHCYQYQACEHPGWRTSAAHEIIANIIDAAVHKLPGYEDADWGIGDPFAKPKGKRGAA